MVCLAFHSYHVAVALRAPLRHVEVLVAARVVFVVDDLDHLGDHVAASLHHYPVADLHAQALDLVHVVQRSPAHGGAANRDRLEHGHWCEFACPPHVHKNVFYPSRAAAGRVFVGDGPARRFASKAQPLLKAHGVHLDHDAVNLIGQLFPRLLALGNKLQHLFNAACQSVMRTYLEPQVMQRLESVGVLFRKVFSFHQQEVGEEIQPALGHDVGLQHADGPRSGVARVSELGQTLRFAIFIHPLKRGQRHDYLAPDFKILGDAGLFQRGRGNCQRHRAHGAHIGGHVLAHRAVTTGNAAFQASLRVRQRQGHAVQFQLADVLNLVGPSQLAHAPVPVAQLLLVVCVVQ